MKRNTAVVKQAVYVKRQPTITPQEDIDRAAVVRHQEALKKLDALEALPTASIPSYGPRTATHPMATPISPVSSIHTTARKAESYVALMGIATAFIAGIALGKAL